MGDSGIKQQLHLEGKKTLEALRQTLELEVIKMSGLPSGSRKRVTEHCGGADPSRMKEKTTDSSCAGTPGATAAFESSVPTNKKKWQPQHHVEMSFTRSITDITYMSHMEQKK
jgi:hypothetical protein